PAATHTLSLPAALPISRADGDPGGERLAAELLPPDEPAEVVDRADRRRNRRAQEEPARLAAEVEEGQRRHHDPEEEREAAQPREDRKSTRLNSSHEWIS